MKRKPRSLPEIRREGFRALVDHLGAADAQRFMQQYDVGRGDYTKERHAWLDKLTLDEILASIEKRRTEQ